MIFYKMKKYILLLILFVNYQGLIAQNNFKSHSILASGKWIKFSANDEGICKITYNELTSKGISSPENVAVYSNGGFILPKMNNESYPDDLEKIPVLHATDKSGNKAIYFYSSGSVKWEYDVPSGKFVHTINLYTDKTFFYLSSDVSKSEAPNMKPSISQSDDVTVSTFNEHLLYENENINLVKSGRRWYSEEIFKSAKKTYTFESPNVKIGEKAILTLAAVGGSSSESYHEINVNDQFVSNQNYPKISPFTITKTKAIRKVNDYQISASPKLNISLTYQVEGNVGSSWLDYIEINQTAELIKTAQPLIFRNIRALNYSTLKYNIQANNGSYQLWDVSNQVQPLSVNYTQNSGTLSFNDTGLKIANYVLFDPANDNFIEASFVSDIANQNIHGLPLYDFIIVTHPNFLEASETLAEHHRQNDNLSVLVVTTDEVYNEFSSGMPDVAAIRNMARMFYKRKTETDSLRFILLMGDGSYNNRTFNETIPNFIPTYQSENSEDDDSFTSDDFFVLLDDNEGESTGTIDIGIGRIPCRTVQEADIVVNKTISYTKPEAMGEWRNIIAFIADDEDSNVHMSYSEQLIDVVNEKYPGFYTDKIYFDAYRQVSTSGSDRYPDATAAINQRVADGALILNYTGHANTVAMAHEDVLVISDINSWSNQKKLPVFVTATCEFSRFDDDHTSAGEQILLNPVGGGVALFSTTRLVYGSPNFTLNKNFYYSVFQKDYNGENFRMGDIMRMAKNLTYKNDYGENLRNFTLLGNPALKLAFPNYKVQTLKINNQNLSDSISIGALDKVTVESEVLDFTGNLLTGYNGLVTSIVYDKEVNVQTLANDGGKKFEYKAQNNIIYKGTSNVVGGKFQFTFIVPKDISYNIDKGRILYYTHNSEEDGNGSTDLFYIGGSSSNPVIDNDPPEVNLYLNNEKFKTNDRVSSSALLLVKLFDESGINTVGTGIGHDIVAIIDNDFSKPMILNDFYQSEINSYQNGQVLFPLNNLDPGEHTISVKVWDVQNNSTVKEISFIVEDGFEITSVINYPNPVSFNTTFEITHNLPGDIFNTTIEIFNLRGFKIYEINETTGSYGTVEATVRWDITETNYPIDSEKLLVYRVTMKNQQGLTATGAGKLLLKLN